MNTDEERPTLAAAAEKYFTSTPPASWRYSHFINNLLHHEVVRDFETMLNEPLSLVTVYHHSGSGSEDDEIGYTLDCGKRVPQNAVVDMGNGSPRQLDEFIEICNGEETLVAAVKGYFGKAQDAGDAIRQQGPPPSGTIPALPNGRYALGHTHPVDDDYDCAYDTRKWLVNDKTSCPYVASSITC
ncbi:hypothetical protein BC832DRAFT_538242 [Gaertneriomyces semiglobifer]|nr:hypothetical protein BC832DRAFT_538242 [Gaertneriomyces semiglobifer]